MTATFQRQHNAAMNAALFCLVQLLHEREILPARSLPAALESGHYLAVAGHDHSSNPCIQVLCQELYRLAQALEQRRRP